MCGSHKGNFSGISDSPHLGDLAAESRVRLESVVTGLRDWNQRVNLISRKDMDSLWTRHIEPALELTRWFRFPFGSTILDIGTGGGIPGLVLAAVSPEATFVLLDSVGKKVKAVGEIARTANLQNVSTHWGRVEDFSMKADFVVGRAVTALPRFLGWALPALKHRRTTDSKIQGGVFYWKGGDPTEDERELGFPADKVCPYRIGPEERDEGKYITFYSTKTLLEHLE